MMLNMQDLMESDDIPLHRLLSIAIQTAALHLFCSLSSTKANKAQLPDQPR